MKLWCIIPTKERLEKLKLCIDSIDAARRLNDIDVYIYFSNNQELQNFNVNKSWLFKKIEKNYKVPFFWNTRIKECNAKILIWLNDDIMVYPDMFDKIILAFKKYFPDHDGVIGINQANIPNHQKVQTAFGAIGIKYADRFPDKKVWAEDYERFFADYEIWQYAKSINKFYFCSEAQIIHLHPAFSKSKSDNTHKDVRKYWAKDKQTFEKRKQLGYLWGKDYQLITKDK